MLPVSAVACLRCLRCSALVIVHGDGHATCSTCGTTFVVAVRVESEGKAVPRKSAPGAG